MNEWLLKSYAPGLAVGKCKKRTVPGRRRLAQGAQERGFSQMVRLEKPECVKPFYAELRPARGELSVLADTEVVLTLRKYVQLHGNLGALQGEVHDDALIRGAHRVVCCVDEHYRRRVLRNVKARPDLVLVGEFQESGIAENGEVGPAARFVDRVDGVVDPFGEVRGRGERKMAADRKADYADVIRVNPPLGRSAANRANGPLRVHLRANRGARIQARLVAGAHDT